MTWPSEITTELGEVSGVTEIVISDDMGAFVDGTDDNESDKKAALLSYLGEIAYSVGDSMSLGKFRNLAVTGEGEKLLLYTFDDHYAGIKLDESANVNEVRKEVNQILRRVRENKGK